MAENIGFALSITGTGVCHDAEGYLLDNEGNRVSDTPDPDAPQADQ